MNKPLIFGLTERELVLMFVGSAILFAAKVLTTAWWTSMRERVFTDFWRGIRYLVMAASGALGFWLGGQPELSPRMTLLMIICCLGCYWAVTSQREQNAKERINQDVDGDGCNHQRDITRQPPTADQPDEQRPDCK